MEKKDFEKCELCGASLGKIQYDSPLYCDKCIEEMLVKGFTARQYQAVLASKRGG